MLCLGETSCDIRRDRGAELKYSAPLSGSAATEAEYFECFSCPSYDIDCQRDIFALILCVR